MKNFKQLSVTRNPHTTHTYFGNSAQTNRDCEDNSEQKQTSLMLQLIC